MHTETRIIYLFCLLSHYLFAKQTRPGITTSEIRKFKFLYLDFINKTTVVVL